MKNIFLVITMDRYPDGDAGAVRTHAFAKILEKIGYEPLVIGMGDASDFSKAFYDNIAYYSLRYSKNDLFHRIYGRYAFKRHMIACMDDLDCSCIKGIMYVSGGVPVLNYLKKLSKKNGIPLFYDCVEWYSPGEFSMGKLSWSYRRNNKINSRMIDDTVNVIAISSYLTEAFSSRKINTIRIPVILDVGTISHRERSQDSSKVNIIYAGSPGKKDHLSELIDALLLMPAEKAGRFCIRFIGLTKSQYEDLYGCVFPESLENIVLFEGRQPREYVVERLQDADFSFLLRPPHERYAMAGFPTKSVEGLSAGTPLLCNLTSDLGLYLKDGGNSIVIDSCSAEGCARALERTLELTIEQKTQMKKSARETAENCFDLSVYRSQLERFIKEAK